MWVTLKKADDYSDIWLAYSYEMNLMAQGASIANALEELKAGVKYAIQTDYAQGLDPRERSEGSRQLAEVLIKEGTRIPFDLAVENNIAPLLTFLPLKIYARKAHFKPAWFAWTLPSLGFNKSAEVPAG